MKIYMQFSNFELHLVVFLTCIAFESTTLYSKDKFIPTFKDMQASSQIQWDKMQEVDSIGKVQHPQQFLFGPQANHWEAWPIKQQDNRVQDSSFIMWTLMWTTVVKSTNLERKEN